jgi:hypothetical protein
MKKLLAMALALVMALSVTTISWADDKAAEFNGQQYDTLLAAVQAAVQENTTAGKTIKLLGDVTEDVADIEGLSNFMLTIDLNGRSYTGMIRKYHDLVVTDTSESNTGTAHFSYVMCNVLKLQGGTIVIDDAEIFHGTYLKGAAVTINGGEYQYSSEANHTKAINFQEGSSLTINSGVFWTNDNLEKGGNTVVQYGDHFVVGRTEQGSYTIQKTSANGTTLYFYDLSTAAKAAADGDTITLLADQTIDRKVEVKNSVTIDGNGKSIALAETVKDLTVGPAQYAHGVFEFSGDNKTAKIEGVMFKNIDRQTVMIRAYNSGDNSCLTVDGCTFDNVKALNVVRASSGDAMRCRLVVTNSTFKNCIATSNGIIQIDSSKTTNATDNEIKNNDFIGNKVGPADNVAVIYLSAPATVQNNYFDGNTTTANTNTKNGVVVTGSQAGGSKVESNAFVSHTFDGGDAQGAVYGAKGATTVSNNYYGAGINHLAKAGDGFSEGSVATGYTNMGSGNHSYTAPRYYYYNSTTTTTKDGSKTSPKTFDAGMGIYAVTAVLSVTGMAWVGKKRH